MLPLPQNWTSDETPGAVERCLECEVGPHARGRAQAAVALPHGSAGGLRAAWPCCAGSRGAERAPRLCTRCGGCCVPTGAVGSPRQRCSSPARPCRHPAPLRRRTPAPSTAARPLKNVRESPVHWDIVWYPKAGKVSCLASS